MACYKPVFRFINSKMNNVSACFSTSFLLLLRVRKRHCTLNSGGKQLKSNSHILHIFARYQPYCTASTELDASFYSVILPKHTCGFLQGHRSGNRCRRCLMSKGRIQKTNVDLGAEMWKCKTEWATSQ